MSFCSNQIQQVLQMIFLATWFFLSPWTEIVSKVLFFDRFFYFCCSHNNIGHSTYLCIFFSWMYGQQLHWTRPEVWCSTRPPTTRQHPFTMGQGTCSRPTLFMTWALRITWTSSALWTTARTWYRRSTMRPTGVPIKSAYWTSTTPQSLSRISHPARSPSPGGWRMLASLESMLRR